MQNLSQYGEINSTLFIPTTHASTSLNRTIDNSLIQTFLFTLAVSVRSHAYYEMMHQPQAINLWPFDACIFHLFRCLSLYCQVTILEDEKSNECNVITNWGQLRDLREHKRRKRQNKCFICRKLFWFPKSKLAMWLVRWCSFMKDSCPSSGGCEMAHLSTILELKETLPSILFSIPIHT